MVVPGVVKREFFCRHSGIREDEIATIASLHLLHENIAKKCHVNVRRFIDQGSLFGSTNGTCNRVAEGFSPQLVSKFLEMCTRETQRQLPPADIVAGKRDSGFCGRLSPRNYVNHAMPSPLVTSNASLPRMAETKVTNRLVKREFPIRLAENPAPKRLHGLSVN